MTGNIIETIDAVIDVAPDLGKAVLTRFRTVCACGDDVPVAIRWLEFADILNELARGHEKYDDIVGIFMEAGGITIDGKFYAGGWKFHAR